jgi:hypothetical protein
MQQVRLMSANKHPSDVNDTTNLFNDLFGRYCKFLEYIARFIIKTSHNHSVDTFVILKEPDFLYQIYLIPNVCPCLFLFLFCKIKL